MGNKKGQRRAKSERTTERYCWMEREHVPWQRLWVQLELKMQLCRWIWQDYSVWVRRSRPIRPQLSLSLCVCVCAWAQVCFAPLHCSVTGQGQTRKIINYLPLNLQSWSVSSTMLYDTSGTSSRVRYCSHASRGSECVSLLYVSVHHICLYKCGCSRH